MAFFEDLVQIQEALNRQIEALGGVYSDPFNEVATVVSVSDPEELGRVKVTYQDGATSDWVYVLGSNKGLLSAQFIGTPCLVGKAHGRSEDAFVLGFFNKSPDAGYPGQTLQIATLSEQLEVYRSPASPGDQGLRCNEGNSGRVYIFDNEISQDLVICLRRNNRQESNEQIWAWKSLTHSKWIEKGTDPGAGEVPTTSNFFEKPGIPKCTKSLEGEIHEFAEDRKFRSSMIVCRRDENGDFGWGPVSSPPLVFRTTLPKCDERVHGMEAIVDSGRDSELAICLRYQGEMKWIHHRTREPIQFHKEDPPPTREQFIEAKNPMPALASQPATPASQDFVGKAGGNIINGFLGSVAPVLGNTAMATAMQAAGALPPSFNPTQALSNAALTALSTNSGVSPAQLTAQLTAALAQGGVVDSNLATALISAGGLGNIIAQGVKDNNLDKALQIAGQGALRQALTSVSPELGGMYTGYAAGGVLGAIDVATMIGANRLPPEISQYITPLLSIGKGVLGTQPKAFSNLLSASAGLGGQSLQGAVGGLLSVAGQNGPIPPQLISGALSALQGGGLGPIAQSLGGFAGLPGIPLIGGGGGVPQLATTALQLLGLGNPFTAFLGPAGLGLNAFTALTGINPITSILGAIPGFGGLFGGGPDCPCDPKCRKTSHGVDSDGIRLLDPCGNVIANSHTSYDPIGNPTENNQNSVAKSLGRKNTKIGEKLCSPNQSDLTEMIKSVNRLGEMADSLENAKNADWPELWSELTYTFEVVERAFKQADNNITGIESIERKLIDAQYRLINKLMVGNGSFFSKALLSIVDTSRAVQDLYGFVLRLDGKKKGGKAGVFATESLKIVFENIIKIAALNSSSKAEAGFILSKIVSPAEAEWKKLTPGLDLISLSDFVLGAVPKDIPLSFSKCKTKRDKNKVLRDSLESRLNSPVPRVPGSVTEEKIPSSILDAVDRFNSQQLLEDGTTSSVFNQLTQPGLTDQLTQPGLARPGKEIKEILDQIKYNQKRTQDGQADC